jgi:hypothetical protein
MVCTDIAQSGQGACLNAVLSAPGVRFRRWFVTLDDDDRFTPYGLETALHVAERANVPFYLPNRVRMDRSGVLHSPASTSLSDVDAESIRGDGLSWAPYGTIVFRTADLVAVGGFDGTLPMMADMDALIRLAESSGPGLCGGDPCYVKREHPDQMTRKAGRADWSRWIRTRPKKRGA